MFAELDEPGFKIILLGPGTTPASSSAGLRERPFPTGRGAPTRCPQSTMRSLVGDLWSLSSIRVGLVDLPGKVDLRGFP